MGLIEIIIIGIGLAMDAFAISICKGLSIKEINLQKAIVISSYFGIFQAGMPVMGYVLSKRFENFVTSIDHWIAFFLLFFIGLNMIKDAFEKKEDKNLENDDMGFKEMVMLSVATSIDALAVGITFAFLNVDIFSSTIIIGIITFIISLLGVFIGKRFGDIFEKKAEVLGGIILILIGIKILAQHLFFT